MAMTLLAMAQAVSDEISFARPASLFSNPDTTARQMLALANREGMEQASEGYWQELRRAGTITTVASQQAYTLPADYDRMISMTIWSQGQRWPLLGPLTPQEWAWQTNGFVAAGPRTRFRIMQGSVYLWPIPSSVDTIVYEYESTGWAFNGTTYTTQWANDTDTFALNDQVFMLGLKWRLLAAKGLGHDQEQLTWRNALGRAMARDAGNRTLHMGGVTSGARLLGWQNIPDGGYGA